MEKDTGPFLYSDIANEEEHKDLLATAQNSPPFWNISLNPGEIAKILMQLKQS